MILTDLLAVIYYDGNPRIVAITPVLAAVDVTDNNDGPALDQGQQLLQQQLAQMAATTAEDLQFGHLSAANLGLQPPAYHRHKLLQTATTMQLPTAD